MQFSWRREVIKDNNDSYNYHSANSDVQVPQLKRIVKPLSRLLIFSKVLYMYFSNKSFGYTSLDSDQARHLGQS